MLLIIKTHDIVNFIQPKIIYKHIITAGIAIHRKQKKKEDINVINQQPSNSNADRNRFTDISIDISIE